MLDLFATVTLSVEELITIAIKAVQDGNWWVFAAVVISALVWIVRAYGAKYSPWLKTDRGGAVLVLTTSILGSFAALILAGDQVGLELVIEGFKVAFVTAGGYSIIRKIIGISSDKNDEKPAVELVPDKE
jgi:hypothetical protein